MDCIFIVRPSIHDVHQVVDGLGLDVPELFLEYKAPYAVIEGVNFPFLWMFAAEFFIMDQRSMYERIDSLERWQRAVAP